MRLVYVVVEVSHKEKHVQHQLKHVRQMVHKILIILIKKMFKITYRLATK